MKYAVVGGGLTGLVAARRLRQLAPDADITLFEASERLGGKIHTSEIAGSAVELGADSFLVREPAALELCRSLSLEGELIEPAVFGANIVLDGKTMPLPVGFLRGVPPDVRSAFRSGLLTTAGSLRAGVDLLWPNRLSGPDMSLGTFVRRRFGAQVLDRLVDPVLAGTRAGIPGEISLAAAAPEIDGIARGHRSVMRGLRKVRRQGSLESGAPPFRSLRGGVGRLIEALEQDLRHVTVELKTPAGPIRQDQSGYSVGDTSFDGAIITTSPPAAAGILGDIAPDAVASLRSIRYASVAVVILVYRRSALDLPSGSGLLVPSAERLSLSACTWYSAKWPQHASAGGLTILRAVVGRATDQRVLDRTDAELIRTVSNELAAILHNDAAPEEYSVVRWEESLPQYAVGHLTTVERIEEALEAHPIFVAGSGYRGSGIPDCIKQGTSAAEALATGR